MAAAMYPDRFTYFERRRVLPTGGYEARLRGLDDQGTYKTWLVLQSRSTREILPLARADDDGFRDWIRGLLVGATAGLTPDDGLYPLSVRIMNFSDRQKRVLLEEILECRRDDGAGDFCFNGSAIRLQLLTPEESFPERNPRPTVHRAFFIGKKRYLETEEIYRITGDRKFLR
jgi:hypothetical protein